MGGICFLGLGPPQESQGEVERVRAAFFHPSLRSRQKREQIAVDAVGAHAGNELLVRHRVSGHVIER